MKIAELISTFPPYHGGMGYVCYHNTLELARRGHEVTVFTLDYGHLSYDSDPCEFRIVRLSTPVRYGDGGMVPQLLWHLKGFDVVHLHFPFFGGAEYAYLASLLTGQRYVLTYHMDVFGNTGLKKAILGVYEPLLTERMVRRASGIGALTTTHLKSSKIASFVEWDKVVELPNGVDVDLFRPREKDERLVERYGLSGKIVALFVGNLQPFKGLHLLIDALSRIADDRVVLLVVGGGYGEEKYRAQVRELGLERRVNFAGPHSPKGDLPAHYNLGDFLVLPSTHSEAFPLVVLEAMASGIPAIVSALPGPSQLVQAGTDGLIAGVGDRDDLCDKVALLARESELRARMGQEARKKVLDRYSWEKVGDLLESLLHAGGQ